MRIPLHRNALDHEEIAAACEVLHSGQLTMGAFCAEFEAAFATFLGVRNAVFVNSGSSANLLALFALANPSAPQLSGGKPFKPGDEVIVPAVTWSTTIWPIVQAGGIPVLVDCDPRTLQIDLDQLRGAISDKTAGIVAVHVLGNAVPMGPLLEIAQRHSLWVVEDTCEALGTCWEGKRAGSFGDLGTFSFFFSHHITTIEGGMVVTNDDVMAELLRCLRAHGWTRQLHDRNGVEALHPEFDPEYLFVNLGFNLRPTEINAVLGIRQLKKLQDFNRKRNDIAKQWCELLADPVSRGDLGVMNVTAGTEPSWFGFPVLCRDHQTRARLKAHLESHEIETRPIICGNMARQPAMKLFPHRLAGTLSGADRIMSDGLYWGSHPSMTDAEIAYVGETVRDFFR